MISLHETLYIVCRRSGHVSVKRFIRGTKKGILSEAITDIAVAGERVRGLALARLAFGQ